MALIDDVATIAKARSSTITDDGESDPSLDNSLDDGKDDWADPSSAKVTPEPFKDKDQRKAATDLENIRDPDDNENAEDELDFDEDDFDENAKIEEEDKEKKDTGKVDGDDEEIPSSNDTENKPDKVALDDAIIARAIKAGLPASDIEAFSKMGNLNIILDNVEKKTEIAAEPGPKEEEFNIDLELDPDVFDEDFSASLNGQVNEKITPVLKGLKDEIASLKAAQQTNQHEAFEREFDTVVGHLDDSYNELLGKEAGRALKSDSVEMQNRGLILEQVMTLAKGKTDKNWTLSDLVSEALPMVFPKHQSKVATEKIQSSLKKRSNQTINRPANRSIRRSPTGRANDAVSEKLTEFGLNPNGDNDFGDENEF